MADPMKSGVANVDTEKDGGHTTMGNRFRSSISVSSIDPSAKEGQMYSMNDIDPVLDAKMRIVNDVGRDSCHVLNRVD